MEQHGATSSFPHDLTDDVTQAKRNNPTVNQSHMFLFRGAMWWDAEMQFIHHSHRFRTFRTHLLACPALLHLTHFDFWRLCFIFCQKCSLEMIPYSSYQLEEDQLIIMSRGSTGLLSMQPTERKRNRKMVNPSPISVQS